MIILTTFLCFFGHLRFFLSTIYLRSAYGVALNLIVLCHIGAASSITSCNHQDIIRSMITGSYDRLLWRWWWLLFRFYHLTGSKWIFVTVFVFADQPMAVFGWSQVCFSSLSLSYLSIILRSSRCRWWSDSPSRSPITFKMFLLKTTLPVPVWVSYLEIESGSSNSSMPHTE